MAVNNYALNNVERFKFWCQKVLPLVYDDSLSYYEVLCKVVTKVNEVIDNENAQNELLNELNSEVGSLAQAQSEQYEELSRAISQAADAILALQTAVAGKVDKAQSASDNGKVLGIVNGQVTPVEVEGGGSGVFYVEYGVTTITEIKNALDNDLTPVLMHNDGSENSYGYLTFFDFDETPYAEFTISGRYAIHIMTIDTDSVWRLETYQYNQEEVYEVDLNNPSFTDITNAYTAGKLCIVKVDGVIAPLTEITEHVAIFSLTGVEGNPSISRLIIDDTNTVDNEEVELIPVNIGSGNAGKVLVADSNGDLLPQSHFEVFPVTYGTTTFLEIYGAVSAMKLPVMVYNNDCFVINSLDGTMGAGFVCAKGGVNIICNCGTDDSWSYTPVACVPVAQGVGNAGKSLTVNASGNVQAQMGIGYLDTAPSANNTNGLLIPVVLGESNDPATKYDGYLYIIHEESVS